ncbi:glycosyltransferase family 2 protein [Hominifimenecus sp. rT4P-3]|uniref:glycosyltransferase family 2 protein n=1 Tax=Hominifimenecus sp. rT4P-3 TaxID=3242979 RepID=UPI003DA4F373
MNESRILAVVVTYNRKQLLKECLESLERQTMACDILVVDNASTDGTGEWLKNERGDRVQYYNTGSNLGGAGGFSKGMREGVRRGYSYLWMMDDDTIPKSDALEQIWKTSDLLSGNYGFLSSFVRWTDGSPCEMNVPGVSKKWREDIDRLPLGMLRVEYASFVSLFLPASVIREVGLPIRQFFIWADDMEYSLRISRRYPCYFVQGSQVVHKMKTNAATDIIQDESDRLDRYCLLFRNRLYVERKKGKGAAILYFVYGVKTVFRILAHSQKNKGKKCRYVMSGLWKGIWFHPEIEFCEETDVNQE